MVTFLRQLRADVPVIVRAYLLGQTDVLAEHCAPQMVEQLSAIIRAQHAQVGLERVRRLENVCRPTCVLPRSWMKWLPSYAEHA